MASEIYMAKKSVVQTNPLAASVFLQADNATKAAAVFVPDNWFDGPPTSVTGQAIGAVSFKIRAYGRVTGGTTTNFTPALQFGTSITAASNTVVATGTAAAYNSASGNWFIEAEFLWDFTSKRLNGIFQAINGTAGTVQSPLTTTQVTAVDLSAAGQGFVISGFFSATNAGNLCYLDYFAVEEL